jgi:hypothetical protein
VRAMLRSSPLVLKLALVFKLASWTLMLVKSAQ